MLRQLYQTYWFYLLCFLAVVTVAGSYRLRISQRKRHQTQSVVLLRERLNLLERYTCRLEQENEDLRRLSYLDGLTGIANRRHFEEVLDLEWRRACRVGKALSL